MFDCLCAGSLSRTSMINYADHNDCLLCLQTGRQKLRFFMAYNAQDPQAKTKVAIYNESSVTLKF